MSKNFQNKIIFPAPQSSYGTESGMGQVIYIPRNIMKLIPGESPESVEAQSTTKSSFFSSISSKDNEKEEYIPCLYLPEDHGGKKLIVYFHGNAEDIGLSVQLLYEIGKELKMHVMAVEYPGYGLYKTHKPCENRMKEDTEIVYDYLTKRIGLQEQDIIVYGRSIGSGPASHLASKRKPFCLFLMSAYTCIKDVARSMFGAGAMGAIVKTFVFERFRNIDRIKEMQCPVFFLHGKIDNVIPYPHSIELHKNCPTECMLHSPEDMDHNFFSIQYDICRPFQEFLLKVDNRLYTNEKEGIFRDGNEEEKKNDQFDNPGESDIIQKQCDIDGSIVNYNPRNNNFEIFFDKKLYTPPDILKALELKALTN